MADFAPGTVLADRFTVAGVLGRGGMATVYLVEDRVRQRSVALKVLHDHLAADSTMRRRLRREVLAAGLVRHEAALVAHELYEIDGTLALSIPFHEGRTLTSRVADEGPLAPDDVRMLGSRVAAALAEAHRHGVLHHDVTANNVLLHASADAVLTDFGLARVRDGHTATATSIMGTPGYAAPEIYDGGRSDPRSDLYGLGVTLYFAATGASPFGAGNPAGILRRQLDEAFTPLAEARPDLPDDLARTIESLLTCDPNRRPPSANEVAEALTGRTPAFVPSTPETWNLSDVEAAPEVPPTVAPGPAGRAVLPEGTMHVVIKRGMRTPAEAAKLASAIAREAGLPADALERTAALDARKLRLVKDVDEATARRLADTAETLGYSATVYDDRPLSLIESAARFFWVPIPIIWVAFGLLADVLPMAQLLLPVCIAATILLTTVVPTVFLRKRAPDGLPLAYGHDLAPQVSADVHVVAPPLPAPSTERVRSDDSGVLGRAEDRVEALAAVVADSELPDAARSDLESTVNELRAQAAELVAQARSLSSALETAPAPTDVGWVHQRLTRLEALANAGQPADPAEQERLHRVLREHEASDDARDALDARRAATLAQLLEIAATAERARRELLVSAADASTTGHLVVERLQREVDSVSRARRELAARQAQHRRV